MASSVCSTHCRFNFTCKCCNFQFSSLCEMHGHLLENPHVKRYLVDLVTSTVEVIIDRENDTTNKDHDACEISVHEPSTELTSEIDIKRNLKNVNLDTDEYYDSIDDDTAHETDATTEDLDSHLLKKSSSCQVLFRKIASDTHTAYSQTNMHNMIIDESAEKSLNSDKGPCDICGHMFKKRNLKRHRESHTEAKHYSCDICSKRFKTCSQLYGHKLHHKKDKTYTCHLCGKSFNNGPNLRQHIKTHTREKTLKCPVCGKLFASNYVLKDHILRHSDEKPYTCTICGRAFRKQQEVKRHMIAHSDAREHPCNYCNKKFKSRSNRLKHEKTHTTKKLKVVQA